MSFWNNIGCIIYAPAFGFGGKRLWNKEDYTKISWRGGKSVCILVEVYICVLCVFCLVSDFVYFILTILTIFFLHICGISSESALNILEIIFLHY